MAFSNFFSTQARKPSGFFGRFYMSRLFEKGNAELNALLHSALAIEPDDHVFELRFGTGQLIQQLAGKLKKGHIQGIDFSKPMVALARKRNRKYIRQKTVTLFFGDFDDAFFEENSFDKVFCVNTVYFWKDPTTTVSKLFRILKPGGRLFIGFHDKSEIEKMPLDTKVFHYYSPKKLTKLLLGNKSTKKVDMISRPGRKMTCWCAIATKL